MPGVLLRVDPPRVLPALLIVVLVHLLAFVVQLAADLRTRRLFIRQYERGSTISPLAADLKTRHFFIRAEQQRYQGGRYQERRC